MNRDEFFAKLAGLDEDRIKKALWNLYWRGPAQLRERIESELDPAQDAVRKRAAAEPPDPGTVLWEVRDFAELARAGAYIAGDRRVSPKERTRWRLTFRRLAADALAALRHEDSGPAEEAVALLIDLACETKRFDYFRSEDPMEAAQFVVSDAAATLWEFVRERHGFARFATVAAAQLAAQVGVGVRLVPLRVGQAGREGDVAHQRARPDAAGSGCVDRVCGLLPRRAGPDRPHGGRQARVPALVQLPGPGLPPQRSDPRPRGMALAAARAPGRIGGRGPAGPPRRASSARRTRAHICPGATGPATRGHRRRPHTDGGVPGPQIGAELPASTRNKLTERARRPAAIAPG